MQDSNLMAHGSAVKSLKLSQMTCSIPHPFMNIESSTIMQNVPVS